MAVIGFSFSKFDCTRKKEGASGSIEIKHAVSITDVKKTTLNVGSNKNEVLKIEFDFNVLYGSELGKIGISGDVIYSDTPEIIEETFKGYEADKKLNSTVNGVVQKFIYNKSIIKALSLSDSLNLPAPIPVMPKMVKKSK